MTVAKRKLKDHIEAKIKSYDMYGHPVKLNFAHSGDNHKTLIGGYFSIIINIFIWTYIGYNVKKLLMREANRDVLHVKSLDLANYGKQNYSEMNFTMFHVL